MSIRREVVLSHAENRLIVVRLLSRWFQTFQILQRKRSIRLDAGRGIVNEVLPGLVNAFRVEVPVKGVKSSEVQGGIGEVESHVREVKVGIQIWQCQFGHRSHVRYRYRYTRLWRCLGLLL